MAHKIEIAADANATTWTDITSLVDWTTMRWASAANRGECDAGSGFDWNDDAAAYVPPSHRRVRVTETDTTPDTVIWQGRTIGDELGRGTKLDGDARKYDVSLRDCNAELGGIPVSRTWRPEEDDTVRIQEFLLDRFIQGQRRPSTDLADTYFSTANPYILSSHMYLGVDPFEVFQHITETTSRQFFITKDHELFYDTVQSTAYAAAISITDVSPNGTTSFAPGEPRATRDATEMKTRVRVQYSNNRVVEVRRTSVETANDIWGDTIVDESIRSATSATTRANRFLDEFDHRRFTYSCYIELDSTDVHKIAHGMTISFRSAACGVLTPLTLRVARLSWAKIGPTRYRADLELAIPRKFGRGPDPGSGGGSNSTPTPVAPVPFVPGTAVSDQATLGIGSTAYVSSAYGGANFPSGLDGLGRPDNENDFASEHSVPLVALETGAEYRLVWDQTSTFFAGSGYGYSFMFSASIGLALGAEGGTDATSWEDGGVPVGGFSDPFIHAPYSPGSHKETEWLEWVGTNGTLVDLFLKGSPLSGYEGFILEGTLKLEKRGGTGGTGPEDDPVGAPVTGQPVSETAGGDGTDGPFTTGYPYAPRSLMVFVNGVNMASELTETNPEAGTWEMAHVIPAGAEVKIYYQGAQTD